jgi:plasmid stabilization system protein ParE
MVKYKVIVSDEAKAAIKEIYQWIAQRESLQVAKNVKNGILQEIRRLSNMPEQHGILFESQVKSTIYRRVLKWSYKIIFTIDADLIEVYVVDILHSKQQNKDFE